MVSEGLRQQLLRHIAVVEEQYPLSTVSPLGTGGTADYFTIARDTIELAAAVKAALDHKLPYFVMGEGQNVLFSDEGFRGLVIHNQASHCVIANDRSQVVVDSGMPLRQFITFAANQGFGGLTHLYGEGGTVGGAVYSNATRYDAPILSSVRFVTVLTPPSRIKTEPSIVRYRSEWLYKAPGQTKLQWLREQHPESPQPIILNIHFQLTSVRADELTRRITKEMSELEETQPEGKVLGPIFEPLPGTATEELLIGAGVSSQRIGDVYPDRYHPNYLRTKGRDIKAAYIAELIEQMQEKVRALYAVELISRLEKIGNW